MKKIISISLGSSKRDHTVVSEFLGEPVLLERKGTDGDLKRARALIQVIDGKVDGIGLGGIDLYLYTRTKRFAFRDAIGLAEAAQITPVADGSGIKNTLERNLIHWVHNNITQLGGKKVLLVSSVDRFGMAEEFSNLNAKIVYGDLMFGLGLPIPIRSITAVDRLAHLLLPIITKLPFHWLYPTGNKQNKRVRKYQRYFEDAEIIAGDWHYINRFLPDQLSNKIIITNTVTSDDILALRDRNARTLITSTPHIGGRSFGTNVLEALILAFAKKKANEMNRIEYDLWISRLKLEPFVLDLQKTESVGEVSGLKT
jgi:hypothetical protein